MIKRCEQCGAVLLLNPYNTRKRFCNAICRKAWWKANPEQEKKFMLVCGECFKIFPAPRKRYKYCSILCRNKANSRSHAVLLAVEKEYLTWGCGGGIDSTAIAILIIQGKIPRPDFAYMTDCGYEPNYVMDYVKSVTQKKLRDVGINLNIINSRDYTTVETINKHGVTIPAYTKGNNGEIIKLSTRCSNGWKVRPAISWLKTKGVKRMKNMVGIAVEERRRVKQSPVNWIQYDYPLVRMNLSRRDCKKIIKAAGWPMPERSSCVFCPNHTDNQWLNIKEKYPGDFERAIEIERDMHKTEPNVYLHQTLVPLDQVKWIGGGLHDNNCCHNEESLMIQGR